MLKEDHLHHFSSCETNSRREIYPLNIGFCSEHRIVLPLHKTSFLADYVERWNKFYSKPLPREIEDGTNVTWHDKIGDSIS